MEKGFIYSTGGVEFSFIKGVQIGGFDDWRMPLFDEAKTLYDEMHNNSGKGGVTLHIDPIFPEGAFKVEWLGGDTSTRRPRFDYSEGKCRQVKDAEISMNMGWGTPAIGSALILRR